MKDLKWQDIAAWFVVNEQTLKDVGRFEGVKGVALEVLRLAPQNDELAALREELAQSRILAADQGLNLKRVKREFDKSQQRLADAERRNSEYVALLSECSEVVSRVHHFGLKRKLEVAVGAALTKPEEAKS